MKKFNDGIITLNTTQWKTNLISWVLLKLSSANAVNLDKAKIYSLCGES